MLVPIMTRVWGRGMLRGGSDPWLAASIRLRARPWQFSVPAASPPEPLHQYAMVTYMLYSQYILWRNFGKLH